MFDHCDQYWLSEYHVDWYEGYADGYPCTNNALESTNDVIKKEATLKDRLQFFICMNKLLSDWSSNRDPKFNTTKKFATKPEVSTHEWTLGFEWVCLKKE